MDEKYLWLRCNDDEIFKEKPHIEEKVEERVEDKYPPTDEGVLAYWQELNSEINLPKDQKAQKLIAKFPSFTVNKIKTITGWSCIRTWLQPEEVRQKLRENNRKYGEQNQQIINQIKLQKGCCVCGYKKSAKSLHYHHLDPSIKLAGVSQIANMEEKLSEIEKCVLVCANCHGEIHDGLLIL